VHKKDRSDQHGRLQIIISFSVYPVMTGIHTNNLLICWCYAKKNTDTLGCAKIILRIRSIHKKKQGETDIFYRYVGAALSFTDTQNMQQENQIHTR
jgi:hypothetical protein